MNNKAQITVEYILFVAIIIILLVLTINVILTENEKNTIVYAAQIGAREGSNKNVYAIYYNDTFNTYKQDNPELLTPTNIEIIEINLKDKKDRLALRLTAHSQQKLTKEDQIIIGSRINYYIRKSITETFNQKANDTYYNPAKSNRYIIETEEVKWI